MTMGPEPRIRIFEMSVRLGMKSVASDQLLVAACMKAPFQNNQFNGASEAAPFKSSPFPLLHHLHKIFEKVMRVMRPGRGFGMILHAEQRQVLMPQAFQRRIVQVDVRQLDFALRQGIGIGSEVMVVGRYLNLPRLQMLHWMIPAMVAKLQLESFPAERDAGQLMA